MEKLYTRTTSKILITDYQLPTLHLLIFNFTYAKRNLPLSASIRFHVPVFIYIFLVKRVKTKICLDTFVTAQDNSPMLCDLGILPQKYFYTFKTTHLISSKQLLTTLKDSTNQLPLFQNILTSSPQIVKKG